MNYSVQVGDENFIVTSASPGAGTKQVDGRAVQADLRQVRGPLYHLMLNDEVFAVQFDHAKNEVLLGAHTFAVQVEDERSAAIKKSRRNAQSETGIIHLKAPMPGLIIRLEVRPGDVVNKGQGLAVIEAMKMENEIKAPLAGTITEIKVAPLTTVEKGASLLFIKPSA